MSFFRDFLGRNAVLRVSPFWDPAPEELGRRARERSFQARQTLIDRQAEDEFYRRVHRNEVTRMVRARLKFINRRDIEVRLANAGPLLERLRIKT